MVIKCPNVGNVVVKSVLLCVCKGRCSLVVKTKICVVLVLCPWQDGQLGSTAIEEERPTLGQKRSASQQCRSIKRQCSDRMKRQVGQSTVDRGAACTVAAQMHVPLCMRPFPNDQHALTAFLLSLIASCRHSTEATGRAEDSPDERMSALEVLAHIRLLHDPSVLPGMFVVLPHASNVEQLHSLSSWALALLGPRALIIFHALTGMEGGGHNTN